MFKKLIIAIMILGIALNMGLLSYAQDDGGDGPDGGGEAGDAADSDIGADDAEDYSQDYSEEESLEPVSTSVSSTTTTGTTHIVDHGGYIYDSGPGVLVGAAVGAGVGAAVGSAAAGAGKTEKSVVKNTDKGPKGEEPGKNMIRKYKPEKSDVKPAVRAADNTGE